VVNSLPGYVASASAMAPSVSTPACTTTDSSMRMPRESHYGDDARTVPDPVDTLVT